VWEGRCLILVPEEPLDLYIASPRNYLDAPKNRKVYVETERATMER